MYTLMILTTYHTHTDTCTPSHTLALTAWDSEIESLTSLIKLHQNERCSAPCGQISAATQPPVLATSPTLKKFELHERSKLDELAHAVMIGRAVFYHFLISVFSLFLWEICTTLTQVSRTLNTSIKQSLDDTTTL